MTTTAFEVLEPPRFRDLLDAVQPDRATDAPAADAPAPAADAPPAKVAKKAAKPAKASKKASKRAAAPEPEPLLDEVVVDPAAQIPVSRLQRAAALAKEITTATDLVASGADPTNALALRRYLRALSREMDELVVRTGDEVAGP